MKEKSILEQALLQVEQLEEAVKSNAKGILASTMKQELSDLLKESIEDEEEVDEQPDPEEETTDDVSTDEVEDEEGLDNADDEPSDDTGMDMTNFEDETEDETEDELPGMGDDFGGFEGEDAEDVVDMTSASDEEVLKVFKAMSAEDGIVVSKDGDNIELTDGDDDYIIKLDDEEDEIADEPIEETLDETDDSDSDDEDVVYEIELDEMDDEEDPLITDPNEVPSDTSEEEFSEAARTKWNAHGGDRTGIKSKKLFKAGSPMNEEVEKLRKQNSEYKKALVLFKEKLNEVAIFNANLAYSTRLFTEHSTTKQEKLNILKRFDSISTLKESKNLYSTIKNELGTAKPITESMVEKLTAAPTTSSSSEVLSESKAYENPQFKRMKDLMSKMK